MCGERRGFYQLPAWSAPSQKPRLPLSDRSLHRRLPRHTPCTPHVPNNTLAGRSYAHSRRFVRYLHAKLQIKYSPSLARNSSFGATYGAGGGLFRSERRRVRHRVEGVSGEGAAGIDAQAGQRRLWQWAQHRLTGRYKNILLSPF